MRQNYQANVRNIIHEIQALNIRILFTNFYKDPEGGPIGYTVDDFLFTIDYLCERILNILDQPISDVLPEKIKGVIFEGDPNIDLFIQLKLLNENIQNDQFEDSCTNIQFIHNYLLIFGLWDKNYNTELKDKIDLTNKLSLELEELVNSTKNNLEVQEFSIKKLKASEELTQKFISETKVIFEGIEHDLNKLGQVEGILSNAKGTQQLILSIKDQVQEILNNAQNEVNLKTKEFEILASDISKSIYQTRQFEQKLSEINGSVNTYSNDFKVQYEEILTKKDYIARLERLAADDTLGTRFDKRKVEIRYSVWIWFISSIAVFFVSLWWSNTVFTSTINSKILSGKGLEFSFFDYFFIFFRTAPAYIVLYFCFSRYIKERNFQEEYAFKSVISMTLTAYSDMLANTDEEKQKAKIEMLQKSITSIYTQPRVHTESNRPFFSFNSKDVSESLKQLVEAIKAVKP